MSDIKTPRPLFDAAAGRERKRRKELKAEVVAAGIVPPNDLQPSLEVTVWEIARLRLPPVNARSLHAEHVARVKASMATFTNVHPILIAADADGNGGEIIDGVVRLEAAKALGATTMACIVIEASAAKRKALRLRLNREQERGTWDEVRLGEILVDLNQLNVDLSTTGFVPPEIDLAMLSVDGRKSKPEAPGSLVPSEGTPVTRRGDLFALGDHRLYCGDALDAASYLALLGDTKVRLIVSDFPYNQPAAQIGGRGKIKHDNFEQAFGNLTEREFSDFCKKAIGLAIAHARPGALAYFFMDWQHLDTLTLAAKANGLLHKNTIVWDKGAGGMGGLYRSAHEMLPLFAVPGEPSVDNVKLGRHGRNRDNIFRYPGASTLGSSARAELKNHPTPKSPEMVADVMLDASNIGDAVLDGFIGSGTLYVAAQRAQRVGFGIELSPAYCDVAIKRWERESGKSAQLIATGESFAELRERRAAEALRGTQEGQALASTETDPAEEAERGGAPDDAATQLSVV